ncbi:MAG TPA: acetyl-CoA hydrolase/transferase C-terminal domain-containing protein [Syntrophomonas sp.]|nr:acetyl-CoA hydrolase/transferase C-terminal domain-containing protein [Syntrophomonas sp.]
MGDIIQWQYDQKKITADQAAAMVKSGDQVAYGEFTMFPQALDEALAKRVNELQDVRVTGVCYTSPPQVVLADLKREHFILTDLHFGIVSRKLHDHNLCNYIPNTYHQGSRIIKKYYNIDVGFFSVSSMDARGYFNLGPSNSITPAIMTKTKIKIVEVNNTVPVCLGGNQESIHISQIDYVVEGNNIPLRQLPPAVPTENEQKIANLLINEIEDGACLQLGIGGLPNAVGALIADSNLKDLGIHSEMMMDSCVDLYDKGLITGAKKTIDKNKMVYTFALGTQKLYDFLDNNPVCAIYPVNYTNDPRVVALNEKVVAINNALSIDLFTQVASESVGTRQVSGTGGQLDFIMGAFNSRGGKGIICIDSTYTDKGGNLHSRITPTMAPGTIVTLPRSLVQYVATEYGIEQFKGKSTYERAEGIIRLAHPQFRDELIKAADEMKIWRRTNKIE